MRSMWMADLLVCGLGLGAVGLLSILLSFFISLGSTPIRRAAWTSGIAYIPVAGAGLLIGYLDDYRGYMMVVFNQLVFIDIGPAGFRAPLFALPGALITFLFWWWTFRRDWVSDDDMP